MGATNKTLELYRTLEEITVFRFDKAINGDLRYLAKEENVTYISIGEAYEEAWKEIFNEYVDKTKGTSIIRSYLLRGEINFLVSRFKIVPALVRTAESTTDTVVLKDALKEIELWGFKVNRSNDLDSELDKVLTALKNSQNKIKRRRQELKDIAGSEKVPTFQEQKVQLHRILNLDIDIKTCTMLEWIAYWDEAYKIVEHKKKSG